MSSRSSRGVTLVELLVSLVIMSVVMLAIMTVFIAVQQNYETLSRSRTAIEGSRSSVSFVERQLRLAGYGLDPRFVFDFQGGNTAKDNLTVGTFGGVAVVTDDLAYRYRDPNWLRRGGVTGTTLTIGASTLGNNFGINFSQGQRFMVMCPGGNEWAIFQLDGNRTAADTTAAVTRVTAPFPTATPPCLQTTTGSAAGYIAMLEERRLRIRDIGGRPFLVAYRSIRNATGAIVTPDAANLNYDPVAADVEDFQVAYVMNRPGDQAAAPGAFRSRCCAGTTAVDSSGNTNWVLMDAASENVPDGDPFAVTAPTVDLEYDHARRYNNHSANIRQVRVSLVVRSQRQDRNRAYSRPLSLENFVRSGPIDGFLRLPMTTTVRIPNMLSRSTFTPDLRTTAGEGNFNGG